MFIGVIVKGGIISDVLHNDDIEVLKKEMIKIQPKETFEPETDDMQIFDEDNNSVYNFDEFDED